MHLESILKNLIKNRQRCCIFRCSTHIYICIHTCIYIYNIRIYWPAVPTLGRRFDSGRFGSCSYKIKYQNIGMQMLIFWYFILQLLHAEKSFRNQIVFTIFQLIWNRTDVRLVPNQSVHGKCNRISVWFKNIPKRFLCVYNDIQSTSYFMLPE